MIAKWGKKGKEVVGGTLKTNADKPQHISNTLDYTLVAESKGGDDIKLKNKLRRYLKRFTSNRKYVLIAGAFVVVVALAAGAYFLTRKDPPVAIPEGPKCTYRILEEAKPNLVPKNVTKLEPMAWEIEKIPGYDQDANCLYVVLTYNINMSRSKKSRELYDKLVNVYNPLEGYETVIVDVAQKPEQLKPVIEFLERQSEVFKSIDPKTGRPKK